MVRLKQDHRNIFDDKTYRSQFHYGSIKTLYLEYSGYYGYTVSIPLWFD